MQTPRGLAVAVGLLALGALACGAFSTGGAPTEAAATKQAQAATITPTLEPSKAPTEAATAEPTKTEAPPTPTELGQARTPVPTIPPTATAAKLALEIVQTQVWADRQGNVRTNILLHNPYDFPVEPAFQTHAAVYSAGGELLRDSQLYFLDGVSGGGGFLMPGETVAANACWTCEEALLSEDYASVEYTLNIRAATTSWELSTEVAPEISRVSFAGGGPTFDIAGRVTNNSAGQLQRISVRVTVFDEAGTLIGAGEASAYDVPAGATAAVSGYGIGEPPAGSFTYDVTALGVNY